MRALRLSQCRSVGLRPGSAVPPRVLAAELVDREVEAVLGTSGENGHRAGDGVDLRTPTSLACGLCLANALPVRGPCGWSARRASSVTRSRLEHRYLWIDAAGSRGAK